MTRKEVIGAMREGKKVTHRYFSPEEWATQQDGMILLEDGVKCTPAEFWRDRCTDAQIFLLMVGKSLNRNTLEKQKLLDLSIIK